MLPQNVHAHEKCESIRNAYLDAVCHGNGYILSKSERTEVLEDRRDIARNEDMESTCLKWLQ
jgi:hypothetical protein